MKINVREELAKLIEVQHIDSELVALRQQADEEKPARIAKNSREFEEKKTRLKNLEEQLKAAQLKKKDKEGKLAAAEEGIRKATAQLYQLKTNKEYKAKLNEIDSVKGDVSLLEEEILRAMDELTSAERDAAAERQVVQEVEKEFRAQDAALKQEIEQLKAQIAVLSDKRKVAMVHVHKQIAAVYNDLVENKGGLALAVVRGDACGGCYMRVTYQHINEIRMYEELVRCVSCGRILYREEDFVNV